jgi:hypothetical protein
MSGLDVSNVYFVRDYALLAAPIVAGPLSERDASDWIASHLSGTYGLSKGTLHSASNDHSVSADRIWSAVRAFS